MTWLHVVSALAFFGVFSWWVDSGVVGMVQQTRHRLRRVPPHLRGRAPVDCGMGVHSPETGVHVGISLRGFVPPPDDVGREFLASVPQLHASIENARRYYEKNCTW